ncbi:MAG TPA: ribosome small subunit-dependent GTPase A [Gemmatimonadales bacterium]|jgi:ribosome biogenesis GTPase
MAAGVVLAREGGSYRVLLDGVERVAVLRGKAKREADRAVAGDRVRIDDQTLSESVLGIDSVEPRKSILERRIPGGRGTRPVAANVDQVLVVVAAADPAPIPQLLDRLLVVAEANDIPALVIINKIDLASAEPVEQHLRATGYDILATAARRGDGIEALRNRLAGAESVFTGPSGAGKSSLMNALEPDLALRVGAISAKVRRGTHTTVSATMIPLAIGGFVVDTPGFSEVGMWALDRAHLDECFPEFRPVIGTCKFDDCTHRTEPGCAVQALVRDGIVPQSRYDSYLALHAELAALPEDWE